MALLEKAILGVGTAISKGVLRIWLGDVAAPIQGRVWDSLIDVLKGTTEDVLAQRKARRQFEVIAEKSANNIVSALNTKSKQISNDRIEFLIDLVSEAVNKAIASPKLVVEHNLDYVELADLLGNLSDSAEVVDTLSEDERSLYHTLLSDASQHIVDIAAELPKFNQTTFAEMLKRDDFILERADQILDEIHYIRSSIDNSNQEAATFELKYLREIARSLDNIQIFGVDVATSSKRYTLSVAYISLSVEQKCSTDHSGETYLETKSVNEVLGNSERLLIRGQAGSGKTTLLQWIAVMCASYGHQDLLSKLNGYIPLFLRLREVRENLPAPEEMVRYATTNLAGKMPHGWIHDKLEKGKAILLIDGLDEIEESRREELKDWLKSLIDSFPLALYILSTRPHAAEENWLNEENFQEAELLDMTRSDVVAFVNHWHNSVRTVESDEEKRDALDELEGNLQSLLRQNRELQRLAINPLLCALICAIHRDRAQHLPIRRVELYRACIDMFLRRDVEKNVKYKGYPELDNTQKWTLLQELALWMMRCGQSQISDDEAVKQLEKTAQSFQSLDKKITGVEILRLFVERSGILRQPSIGIVDFPHLTFQEYLSAQAVLNNFAIKELIQNAHIDQWSEVIILTAGSASRPNEAEELINGLISRGDIEPQYEQKFYLLALAALHGIVKFAKESNVKPRVSERLSKIVPPKDINECKVLSAAGNLIVPHLSHKQQDLGTAVLNMRCLSMIGTDEALNEMDLYAADKRRGITKELEKCLDYAAEFDKFKSRFLQHRWIEEAGIINCNDTNEFVHEVSLTNIPISDIACLSNCPELLSVSLKCTMVSDISPLEKCKQLKYLDLSETNVVSISSLSSCSKLSELNLSGTAITDLSVLTSCNKLQTLNLSRSSIDDISPLSDCKHLKSLNLNGSAIDDISPLSNCNQLQSLNLSGSAIDDVTPLSDCNQLQWLDISRTEINNIGSLAACKSLKSLKLDTILIRDLSPLAHCTQLERLYVNQLREINRGSFKRLKGNGVAIYEH